jgi:hypothetical protein
MSTAASPAPSEGESKRGEVAYRFCQDWLVRPSHLDLRNSLTRFAVQIQCWFSTSSAPDLISAHGTEAGQHKRVITHSWIIRNICRDTGSFRDGRTELIAVGASVIEHLGRVARFAYE